MKSFGRSLEKNKECKREKRRKGTEGWELVSLFLGLSGLQRGHLFDLRASSPLSGFPDGLKSSWPLSTLWHGLGFVIITHGYLCYLHPVRSTLVSHVCEVLRNPASARSRSTAPGDSPISHSWSPATPQTCRLLPLP